MTTPPVHRVRTQWLDYLAIGWVVVTIVAVAVTWPADEAGDKRLSLLLVAVGLLAATICAGIATLVQAIQVGPARVEDQPRSSG